MEATRRGRSAGARALCVLLAIALGTGCTTVQPLEERWGGSYDVQPGDRLRIVTHDGRDFEVAVGSVTAEAIVGEVTRGDPRDMHRKVTLPFQEIARIEHAAFSGTRTGVTALGVGVAAGAVLMVVWVFAAFAAMFGGFEAADPSGAGPGPPPARPGR